MLEVDLAPGVTVGLSSVPVVSPSLYFEPLILENGWSQVQRFRPLRPGLPPIPSLTVRAANRGLRFSQLLSQYEWLNKTARYKIALGGTAYSSVGTYLTGTVIAKPPIGADGVCTIQIQDKTLNRWKRRVPGEITADKFPNLPENLLTTQANIVFGKCSSVGKGDQGAIPCVLIDTVLHRYLVACHRMYDILDGRIFVPTQFADIAVPVIEIGSDGWTYIRFETSDGVPLDVEDPDFPNQFAVAVDGEGLYDWDGDGHLFTNPSEILLAYHEDMIGGYSSSDFNGSAYAATRAAQLARGHVLDGVINTPGMLHENIIDAILKGGSMLCVPDTAGKLYLRDYVPRSAQESDPEVDHNFDIQENTLSIDWNRDVVNSIRAHFDYDALEGVYKQEPPAFENLLSQAEDAPEDLELLLVSDPDTARQVVENRLYYSDEGRPLVNFQLAAPAAPATLELDGTIKVTHKYGLSDTKEGWTNKAFSILGVAYDPNRTPKISVLGIGLDPEASTYPVDTLPANVENMAAVEDAAGTITLTWTLAGGGDDPEELAIYYRRDSDDLRHSKYAGTVDASALTFDFTTIYPEAGTLHIYAVPISADGMRRLLDWIMDPANQTTLAEDINLTEASFQVVDGSLFSPGAKTICGREMNEVESESGNVVSLISEEEDYPSDDSDTRVVIEGRARFVHASGTAIGLAIPTVAATTLSLRTKITTPILAGVISGLGVNLTITALTDPNDLAMFHHWEIWRGLTDVFEDMTLAADFVSENTYRDDELDSFQRGPWYYRTRAIAKSGVASDPSDPVGPYDLALELGSVSLVVQGETFIFDAALPGGVTLDQLYNIVQYWTETPWSISPTWGIGNAEFNVSFRELHKEGADPEKTYYFAWLPIWQKFIDGVVTAMVGGVTYLGGQGTPTAVTSGTGVKLQGDNETNYIGNPSDASNRIGYNQQTGILTIPVGAAGAPFAQHDHFEATEDQTVFPFTDPVNTSVVPIVMRGSLPQALTTHFTFDADAVTLLFPCEEGEIVQIWSTRA